MSTRSVTIIRQSTYWGGMEEHAELMRFYRHCDGYPEGHGLQMALAVRQADKDGMPSDCWLSTILHEFMKMDMALHIEFEPWGRQHGDLKYLYVVEGIVDQRRGATHYGRLPVTISVYDTVWDEDYDVAMARTPIFSGTAYEYIERFGKEQ